jgi:hypothetical protein
MGTSQSGPNAPIGPLEPRPLCINGTKSLARHVLALEERMCLIFRTAAKIQHSTALQETVWFARTVS